MEQLNSTELNSIFEVILHKYSIGGQEDGVPKAGQQQAAADSQGSQTCMCANTLIHFGVAHAGVKDESTSCRGTV